MANKNELLEAISAQTQSLQDWLNELSEKSKQNRIEIESLRQQRSSRIDQYVADLLPNIEDQTLNNLVKRLPGFMRRDEMDKLIAECKSDQAAAKSRLLQSFRPDTAASDLMTLETELEAAEKDFELANNPEFTYGKFEGFNDLYDDGYGTPDYSVSIFNLQYYRDWKLGDQVLKQSGCKNWTDLRGRFESDLARYTTLKDRVAQKKRALDVLQGQKDSYDELLEEEVNLPVAITERLQVTLRAHLDNSDDLPKEFATLASLSEKIKTLQTEATEKIEASRTQISAQLADLNKLRKTVSSSRSNDIPDKYVQEIRTRTQSYQKSRSSGGGYSGGYHTPTTTIYVHDDNWMLNAILYNEMIDHFGHSSRSESYGGGYGRESYGGGYGRRDSYDNRDNEPVYSTNSRVDDGGGSYSESNNVYGS